MMWGMEIVENGWQRSVGGILLIYGRIFGLYWNGIYAVSSEGKHNNGVCVKPILYHSRRICKDRLVTIWDAFYEKSGTSPLFSFSE